MRGLLIRAVIGLSGPVAALVALAGCTVTATGVATPGTTAFSSGPCQYAATPAEPAPPGKAFGLPGDPSPTPNTGTVTLTLRTSQGPIPMTLNRAQAPCTVQSIVFLAQRGYFDGTPCHRLTADPALKVLQCGDPTGQGEGGPGYTIPDENPTGFAPAPAGPPGTPPSVIYPTGTVAMANTGQPHSGGSQFFLVYGDSQLPPSYAVFGTVGAAGLTTLNTIAAGGIVPGMNAQDGRPRLPVTISNVVVSS